MQEDKYIWKAEYQDNSTLFEFDSPDSPGHGFAEAVNKGQIKALHLYPLQGGGMPSVQIPDDATPVFFRRRKIATHPDTGLHERSTVAHCIGWKRDQQECYLFVFEDGSTLLTSDLQAV